jgi:uncharacterized protein (UPF0332 family)
MIRSRETLDDAKMLLDSCRLRSAVNRIYYAIFYAVGALALNRGFSTASHAQLRGWFNREFVKAGIIDVAHGKLYGLAFDRRTKGDYDDQSVFEIEEVETLYGGAVAFVDTLISVLNIDLESSD